MTDTSHIRICFQDIAASTSPLQKTYFRVLENLFKRVASPHVRIDLRPKTSAFDFPYPAHSAYAAADMVNNVLQAEKDGYDAILIGCWLDPGLTDAKAMCKVPVVGVGESSMHFACLRCNRFGVIRMDDASVATLEDNITRYGLRDRVVANRPVRSLGMNGQEIQRMFDQPDPILERFHAQAIDLVHNGAEFVFPGCTPLGMLCYENDVYRVRGAGIPIVDPVSAALKLAEAFVGLRRFEGYIKSKGGK